MDIYEFINSPDVANHCRQIGHVFTATEFAYFIWRSNHHPLVEKHQAWQEIIDTMPDEDFYEGCYEPLHRFLKIHMKEQRLFLKRFVKGNGKYIYTYSILCEDDENYCHDGIFYDNYQPCFDSLKSIVNGKFSWDIQSVKIERYPLHSTRTRNTGNMECESITMNRQLTVMDIQPVERYYNADNPRFYLNAEPVFQEMCVGISSPFKTGDIVCDVHSGRNKPLVVEGYTLGRPNNPDRNGLDYMFRMLDVWMQDDDGYTYKNLGKDYLDYAYYQGKLVGYQEKLQEISKSLTEK